MLIEAMPSEIAKGPQESMKTSTGDEMGVGSKESKESIDSNEMSEMSDASEASRRRRAGVKGGVDAAEMVKAENGVANDEVYTMT
jgi:hypothetical protein